MDDIFNSEDVNANYLDQLVGEGKKFKDQEALAKGKFEADKTIEARDRELAELREELTKRLSNEDLLKQFESHQQRNTNTMDNVKPEADNITPSAKADTPLKDEDLIERIRNVTKEDREREQMQANLEVVKDALLKAFGTPEKAAEAVRQKASELGVSVDFLQSAAAKSPKAFFVQLGLESQAQNALAPRSDVNVQSLNYSNPGIKEGTYEWYRQIQKTNPGVYFSPKIQNQLMKDALRLGDAFYST